MYKTASIALLALVFNACSNADKQKETNTTQDTTKITKPSTQDSLSKDGLVRFAGDSVVVTPFEIEIQLSPKAIDKLNKANETIIVDVMLEGTPKDSAHAKFGEDGIFYVGAKQKEIKYGQIAKFDDLKISRKIYDQLADKDAEVNINVYTGRKSSQNNLIDCEPLFGKLSKVVNKKSTLKGKLIYGDN